MADPSLTPDPTQARSVDWFSVHLHVAPLLTEVGDWPLAGSLAWQRLDDRDPAKLAALFDAARHHALRVDAAQTALAEASHAIAGAADWRQIAQEVQQRRSGAYIPRVPA
jgi:hypothetical protein